MDKKRHSMFTHTARWLGFLIALAVSTARPVVVHAEKATQVYIITSPGSNYQTRVANTLVQKLSTSGIDSANIPTSALESLTPDDNAVFITFGGSTSATVRQHYGGNAQLNIAYNSDHIKQPNDHNHSVLTLTQPACRQVLFIRKLAPGWKSAAIITSKTSSKQIDAIRQCARQYGLTLRTYHAGNEKELLIRLVEAVEQNDVLLALVDVVVYNSRSIKNILLTAYRHRKPVIGYSNSLVDAGAVAAIYTSAEDAGMQAAEIIQEYFSAQRRFSRRIYTP